MIVLASLGQFWRIVFKNYSKRVLGDRIGAHCVFPCLDLGSESWILDLDLGSWILDLDLGHLISSLYP